ncbi:RagB/SusD family nutrient uptake outer membrane protein [Pedobacter frigiditerrae]|uniref:RagB/SusD family nutrient uptake outer membrane protein n=1 Tax=Pedobacter frigiditerrae TaxID=2530452 RepID=A0A4R0MTZ4_9SPHI|nr:RagB/SusD family nutrient uptake outer membrane protein [Pedobacter frigiditerrae]TCC90187.1 RagB/SusD family nutrient uptake outer membrane protein [Pedobacter frigiditerrae]
MNNYKKYFAITCLFLALGCTKKFEAEPLERITGDLIFDPADKNADYAKQFLNGTYLLLPDWYNRIDGTFLDAGTDDAVPSRIGTQADFYRTGRISSSTLPDDVWRRNYLGIRKANLFLSKIDVVPTTDLLKTQFKAEARFLRAYFYFELVKRWGGVPLIGDKVYTIDDDINIPRNSLDECYAYIVGELDAIKTLLLPYAVSDGDWGRANLGAALALKSRVLLYAASPLSNPTNNTQKWVLAAQAAADVKALGYTLVTDWIANFNATKNTEFIFIKENALNTSIEVNNGPIGYLQGVGLTSPSQNLVDAFLMLDGKAISDPGSIYNPNNPYANRDPRLTATIMHNGKNWLGRPVETFDGGQDKPGGNRTQTRTGYYLRKFMGKFETSTSYANQGHHVILLRYAEILLNHAEALNESGGAVADIVNNLVLIRKRAGITAGANNLYGLSLTLTKDQLRTIIQNERRIEFAFEEHRTWDLRRWKLAEVELNKPIRGVQIVKTGTAFTYNYFNVVNAAFDASKMYWYPIPQAEMLANNRMVQNPGWSN